MADNLKAAAFAAGLSPSENQKIDSFSKALAVHRELSNLPPAVANKKYNSLTPDQQKNLQQNFGNEDPTVKPKRGWLGTAWHYTGGALGNAIGYTGSHILAGLGNVSDVMTRGWRTVQIAGEQGVDLGKAWDIANDKGDKVFSPDRISDAKQKFGVDAVEIAMRIASGENSSKIMATATPEQIKYLQLADPRNKQIAGIPDDQVEAARGLFQDTQDAVNAAKYSPGRYIANLVLPSQLEGSGFFYKAISGAVDAAYRVFADPLLIAGKVKRLVDVNKYALEVVVGNGKVAEHFARADVKNFWNQYGKLLDGHKAAEASGKVEEALLLEKQMTTLAPELGPAVIKALQTSSGGGVKDALTAKAFFENIKGTEDMFKGYAGRQRVIMPRLDAARKTRIAAVTTGRKVFSIDAVGPKLVDDYWFGGAATTDGIAETIMNGKDTIIEQVTKASKFKGIHRFSTEYIQWRIDRAKAAFTRIPMFEKDVFDVLADDAPEKIYRLAIMVMPQRESKMFAQAFKNAEGTGLKKNMYEGLWATIAEIRGMNTNLPGQHIVRYLTGKSQAVFGLFDDPYKEVGSVPSDFSRYASAPSLKDLDRAAARNTLFQKILGVPNTHLASQMVNAWSFFTLAGPRYAIRNAAEDLMVNLAIGESTWGLAKSRYLSTRINTYLQAVKKVEGGGTWGDNPLGMAMRFVNRKDVNKTAAELTVLQKKFDDGAKELSQLRRTIAGLPSGHADIPKLEAQVASIKKDLTGGITNQAREIFAKTLTTGRIDRYRQKMGLKSLTDEEVDILTEQIKYGDIENALSVASEGGLNYVSGNDYVTRSVNLARQTGTPVHDLTFSAPGVKVVKKPGERGFKPQAVDPEDDASLISWMMSLSKYANDDLGAIALANADDKIKAMKLMRQWLETKAGKQYIKDAMLASKLSEDELLNLAFTRAVNNVTKHDESINLDLLNKIRVKDKAGNWRIEGNISLSDLPKDWRDVPRAIVGPTLIPAVDVEQITSNVMMNGWTFLGLANARMSRQPIVLNEMIKIRKQMRKAGFEQKWIEAHTKGIDATNAVGKAVAEERARKLLATVVEERAVAQVLQYVDNPMVRSQIAFSSRNFARFYRATEDFYRRMYRVVKYNPEAIVKAALTYEGITHSGWIKQDDQGESYFIYPGVGPVYNAVQNALEMLGIKKEFKVPFPVEFGAKVKMITPSLNPDSLIPTFSGPISGLSFGVITKLISGLGAPGAADKIRGYALGKYAVDQPFVSLFLPAHINRAISMMSQDDRNSQYASAWRKAVTYLEASGHGLQKKYDEAGNVIPPTPAELEEYRLAVKNTTMSILGLRFVFGFLAPASPQIMLKSDMAEWIRDNGKANFKQAWNDLINQFNGDYDMAMAKWVELYPNQIPFTLTESEKKSIAPLRYAQESGLFVDQNKTLFKDYPNAAAFLIPHKTGFSWDAYRSMKGLGLLQNKRVDDYLREVQTAAALQEYYAKRDEYESSLKATMFSFEKTQLRQQFNDWKDIFFAANPLAMEELSQSREKAFKRQATIGELTDMLDKNLNISPKTEAGLRKMLKVYQDYQNERMNLEAMNFPRELIANMKDDTIVKLRELSLYNENTKAAYDVLFGPLLQD